MAAMDVNPYESPKHHAERQKRVLVIRKKVVVPALCAAGLFHLARLYFDWNYLTWDGAEVIGDVLFASLFFIFAAVIAAGWWPRRD
jgi:phosphotransferase system  glucose/maltose/N-acetylglucosamine-specific IIC component